MRPARKLFLLVGMAFAVTAMTASHASAQFEIYDENNGDQHCPAVVLEGHTVSGGCHIEFASTVDVPLHVYVPQKVTVFNCEIYFEGLIDETGEGYVTEAHLDPPHSGSVPCIRTPCDEVEAPYDHPMIPWPLHLREHGAGDEELAMELCLRPTSAYEGTVGAWCELHFPFSSLGGHQYELGHLDPEGTGTEVFCENNPPGTGYTGPHALMPAPTSFEVHFETIGTEEVGIVH